MAKHLRLNPLADLDQLQTESCRRKTWSPLW